MMVRPGQLGINSSIFRVAMDPGGYTVHQDDIGLDGDGGYGQALLASGERNRSAGACP
jgi:hypothetical protein